MLAVQSAFAEPPGDRIILSPMGGVMILDPAHRGSFPSTGLRTKASGYFGGRLGFHPAGSFGFEAAIGHTRSERLTGKSQLAVDHYSGSLVLQRMRGSGGIFMLGGAGWATASAGPLRSDHVSFPITEYGIGGRFRLRDPLSLRLEARGFYGLGNQAWQINDFMLSAGLDVALGGRARDSDHDGVPDKIDRAPDTPFGAEVDRYGVPVDDDGDGVPNGIDRHLDTPRGALVDPWGVPLDSDHDGIYDGLDRCPETPAGYAVDEYGCPSDGDDDGVVDGADRCPHTPRGCTVDAQGCPGDSDGDGVCDGLDRCPDTSPGIAVDQVGCTTEVVERETELIDTGRITTQRIRFGTGSSEILPESFATLVSIAQVLIDAPELQIEIGGHCDNRGSEAFNLRLSEARARAVVGHLVRACPALDRTRFAVRGYGRSRPVVPNTSAENMARNRRVEFVVLNPQALQRVIERRRPLRRSAAPADSTR